jgi:hypothetical protein
MNKKRPIPEVVDEKTEAYARSCRRKKRDLFQKLWMNGKRHMTEVADE